MHNHEYDRLRQKIFSLESNLKLSLDRIEYLLEKLSLRKKDMKVIQIVGTNGKGSTCAFLESILMSAGLKVGVFTSPHLASAKERIRINQQNISNEDFVICAKIVLEQIEAMQDKPSFFEAILAMCLVHFKNKDVQVAVLEAGLGGRLDATTACNADILGVSSISLDHTNILGNSLEKIAFEKISAAQIGQTVVSVKQPVEAWQEIVKQAQIKNLNLLMAQDFCSPSSLPGIHQYSNAGLAVSLVQTLGYDVTLENIKKALLNTKHIARFEVLDYKNNKLVIDGAHNVDAMEVLFDYIEKNEAWSKGNFQLIYSGVLGHDSLEIIKVIKKYSARINKIYLVELKNKRGLSFEKLKENFLIAGFSENILAQFESINAILDKASHDTRFTLVCGSLYLAGEIRSQILPMEVDEELPFY